MLNNIAKDEGITLEELVKNMLKSGETLKFYAENEKYRIKINNFFGRSSVRFLLHRFKRYLNTSESDVRGAMPWWMDRIREVEPGVMDIISVESSGQEWLVQRFMDLIKICKEYV